MKIKTFVVTFILFLTVFFVSLGLISVLFLNIQVETAIERAGNEHYLISDSMAKELKNLMDRGAKKEDAMEHLYAYYAARYAGQRGYLEIYRNGKVLYGSLPSGASGHLYDENNKEKGNKEKGNSRTAVLKELDGKEYMIVTGDYPGTKQEYKIQYFYDITSIIRTWERLRNILLGVGTLFSLFAAVSLMLLLDMIFRPFSQVAAASKEIAEGNYQKRILRPGTKELAAMADGFNDMADKVQQAVSNLQFEARQKQQFIDNFSHEIRTPLTSVCGFAEYMQRSALSEEERITVAGYIIEDSHYILKIADRLLELATLNNLKAERKECAAEDLFANAEKLLYKRLDEKKITLDREAEAVYVYGDEDLLQSLLVNLTNNAIAASEAGGKIWWRAFRQEEKVVLSVTDYGKGMPEGELEKIQEPFYRIDPSRNRESGNAGLGLAICRQIVQCHNAQLQFESKERIGTTVKIIFTASK